MAYAIAIFPKNLEKIESIRKKYDPRYKNIPAHITLVFPFPESITKERFIQHTEQVCAKFKMFEATTDNTEISWDNALILLIEKGKDRLKELHDRLYSGILSEHLSREYEYRPHITMGIFDNSTNAKKIQSKYPELKMKIRIDSIKLLQLDTKEKFIKTNIPKIIWSKEMILGSGS